ncbi:MAG: CPBP family intramembrane glutamic endopeptidase [Terracidiphilus sp.]|jgi:membrane protease YdiL (CAAX protease family)
MEPEIRHHETAEAAEGLPHAETTLTPEPPAAPEPWETRAVRRVFLGNRGLRTGWAAALFIVLFLILMGVVGFLFYQLHLVSQKSDFSAQAAFFSELMLFLALVGAGAAVALAERRSFWDYNLRGPNPTLHFVSGLVAGFVALSALIGVLAWGGWMRFGPIALTGMAILKFGALWGAAFLLVGCVEEGTCRCFLLSILTRGINFWWALGTVGAICLELLLTAKGNGIWGVYGVALLGLGPCLALHVKKAEGSGFWQASWVTSTLFGFVHTGNGGENWIGIFAAAAIGFVFCVSVRVTGSAWWAIGCHASWDWAETYFYGAADSGNVATGHYMTTSPVGNVFWSGGSDGPEGSVLVLAVIVALMAVVVAVYGRGKTEPAVAAVGQLAG